MQQWAAAHKGILLLVSTQPLIPVFIAGLSPLNNALHAAYLWLRRPLGCEDIKFVACEDIKFVTFPPGVVLPLKEFYCLVVLLLKE